MISEAVILAGGLGTRLRSAVPDLPKCMAPVAGKPFLSFIINSLLSKNISRFVFSLGYKHEVIEEFLLQSYPSLQYELSVEETPLGTGGALFKATALCFSENILALNGDTFFSVDTAALSAFHEEKRSDCTLALKPMTDTDRYGVVEMDKEQKIISFKEKRWYEKSLINGGVYALNRKSFLQKQLPVKFSFEKDYLERYFPEKKMYGFIQKKYFIDIGIPDDFRRAQTELPKNIH